jgi:hypothetical protein
MEKIVWYYVLIIYFKNIMYRNTSKYDGKRVFCYVYFFLMENVK